MTNNLNKLTELYTTMNGGCTPTGYPDSGNGLYRMNSVLNNSFDMRKDSKKSIDSMWSELVAGQDLNYEKANSKFEANNRADSVNLSRILAQSYSYSSDSSTSPQPGITKSSPHLNGNNPVFTYMDDSRNSFSYSSSGSVGNPTRRTISASEPGSPTLDDAILMGCSSDQSYNQVFNKMNDITIADLVSTLSLGNSSGQGPVSLNGRGIAAVRPPLNPGNPFGNLRALPAPQTSTPSIGSHCAQGYMGNYPALPSQNATSPTSVNNVDLMHLNQLQNMWLSSQMMPTLDTSSYQGDQRSQNNLSNIFSSTSDPYAIEKAAKLHRSAAAVCDAACTWSGQLPVRQHKNPCYSCKVFLGGVPWDVTELALRHAFMHFGNIKVEWPGKDNSCTPPRGYVYILFENETQVKALLSACVQDFGGSGNYYYKISSKRMRQKEVQVIPWVIGDSNYVRSPSHQLDPAKTVFVGALHGMMTAEGLANIMNDLFNGVVYSGIDTDKHKYPIGSGRVTFNNEESYRRAVRAGFIAIKTSKFNKKVQVDPYLADSLCQLCGVKGGPYFCRDEICFKYYCRVCWELTHPADVPVGHKPLMRNSKLQNMHL